MISQKVAQSKAIVSNDSHSPTEPFHTAAEGFQTQDTNTAF